MGAGWRISHPRGVSAYAAHSWLGCGKAAYCLSRRLLA